MKTEKFRLLCRKILVPIVSDAVHAELKELSETIEMMSNALAHIERRLDDLGTDNPEEE